jgi:hypothetical protein
VNHPDTFNQVLWQKGSTVTKDRHFWKPDLKKLLKNRYHASKGR